MVKGEGKNPSRFQDTLCFPPTLSEEPLVKSICIFRLSCFICNHF